MNTKDIQLTKRVSPNGSNISFYASMQGASLKFRIHFSDKSRKNAIYKDLTALDCYFEGIDDRPNFSNSHQLDAVTDLCLFVERKKQWILEHFIREL